VYAKLSATITRSSVWRESPPTRCVWITLLAVANEDGFVKGVEAWLANEANVSREECRAALEVFEAPDPDSQDQDYAGRRIERVEGGWLILNYTKYRGMRTKQQVLAAQRQSRKRARTKGIDTAEVGGGESVTPRHAASRFVTPIAPASAPASASEGEEREKGPAANAAPMHAARFEHLPHREAYLTVRRAHRFPWAFDAALEHEVHAPISGGPGFAWEIIGAALLQLQGNGESFNVARLRGYCRSQDAGAARRPASGPTGEVAIGTMRLTPDAFWTLCVEAGLTAPMLNRGMLEDAVSRLTTQGRVTDPPAFLACVLAVNPAGLAEIKFAKTREERLVERLQSFAQRAA
jgi:hypothetical protein